jgi:glycosyltransferase involved in cell wall biosynthesis
MDSTRLWRDPADRLALARARGAIGEQRAGFELLAGAATRAADPLEAAALARMAFTYGMFNHPGMLASAPLERLLQTLGRTHVPGTPAAPGGGCSDEAGSREGAPSPAADAAATAASTGSPERVLHVATVVYETGGHGRVLERWLERDRARTPTVLLLKDDEPVPASLTSAVATADGAFAEPLRGDLFAQARALRVLASAHDLVVLHVSNHEVVVPLALADPVGRPPTIVCNHASHQLWAGVGCADVVASLNAFDAETSVVRRGVAPQRSLLLPPPATPRPRPPRAEARRLLGLDPTAPVVLTIASPYKLRAVLAPTYADLVSAVLDAVPDATLLLVGPRPEDGVVPAGERVRALGPVADIGPHLAAADLLLDSWPVTGGTTALDAGAAGLPVLALGDPAPAMVGAPPDLLGGAVARGTAVADLAQRAAALLADPDARAALAARARAVVETRHDAGWTDALEALVAAARAHAGAAAPPRELPGDATSDWEAVIHLVRTGHEQACSLEQAYAWNAPALPPARRPRSGAEVAERIAELRAAAPSRRRAVAAPAVEAEAIADAIAQARRLAAAGEIGGCAIVVAPERIEEAVAHIEAALAHGEELDVELLAGEDAVAAAALGDVILAVPVPVPVPGSVPVPVSAPVHMQEPPTPTARG